nr:hypothetical protein [uncultured Flavobacterium sp.]
MKFEILESLKNKKVLITIIPLLSYEHNLKLQTFISDLKSNNCKISLAYKLNDIKILNQKKFLGVFSFNIVNIFFHINFLKWYFRFKKWSGSKNIFFVIRSLLKQIYLAVKIKSTNSFDAVFIWNPYCSAFGVFSESLKKLNVEIYSIEYGALKNTLLIDNGFVFDSKLLSSFNCNFEYYNESLYKSMLNTNNNLYKQEELILPDRFIDSNKIKILVLGLSEVDANVYPYWSKERKSVYKFFKNGLEQAKYISNLSNNFIVIFKPHPSHNTEVIDKEVYSNLWVLNGNPIDAIKWSDIVVANGTKLEIDAIINNKPVVNITNGLLWQANASYKVSKKEDIKQILDMAYENGIRVDQLTNFKFFISYLYLNSY